MIPIVVFTLLARKMVVKFNMKELSAIFQFVGLVLVYNLDKKTLNKMNEELKAKHEAEAVVEQEALAE